MEGSGPTVCPLALWPTESQAPVLNGTLVASPCHDGPQARNHQGSWLASNSCGQVLQRTGKETAAGGLPPGGASQALQEQAAWWEGS